MLDNAQLKLLLSTIIEMRSMLMSHNLASTGSVFYSWLNKRYQRHKAEEKRITEQLKIFDTAWKEQIGRALIKTWDEAIFELNQSFVLSTSEIKEQTKETSLLYQFLTHHPEAAEFLWHNLKGEVAQIGRTYQSSLSESCRKVVKKTRLELPEQAQRKTGEAELKKENALAQISAAREEESEPEPTAVSAAPAPLPTPEIKKTSSIFHAAPASDAASAAKKPQLTRPTARRLPAFLFVTEKEREEKRKQVKKDAQKQQRLLKNQQQQRVRCSK